MNRTRNRWFETTAAAVLAFALTPFPAAHAVPALPTGGKVVAGQASIGAPAGGALVVNQSSGKAIINWNGFSIGAGGKVQFDNGSGATLNRVTGAQVSSLDGLLSATGSVYLINPNGVIIGKSGVVNVGGTFVASTLDTSNTGFLAGGPLSFTGPSSAAVVNYGKIGALGGDVALIATRVGNAGAITAAHGDAGLLAGSKVVLRDASLDDGRFAVELGGAGTSATNSGLIAAADAELRAEGGNVYALAGDTAGVIRATGVKSGGGHVWLTADGGTLDVAGVLEAQGAGGKAGSVETSGRTVGIGAARIDAHGGTWLVDPDDLTIDAAAATTIDTSLDAGTSVTEQTTATGTSGHGTAASGPGDIIVTAPLSWNTTAALTLSAYRDVDVNAAITLTSGGTLNLSADNAARGKGPASGTVVFGTGGLVTADSASTINVYYNPASYTDAATNSTLALRPSFSGPTVYTNPYTADVTGGTLRAYMLVDTLAQLGGGLTGVGSELDGLYALNADLDAASTAKANPVPGMAGTYYGLLPIGFTGAGSGGSSYGTDYFTGQFDGQGHTISNLYVNHFTLDANGNPQGVNYAGLFGYVNAGPGGPGSGGGIIHDLNLVNATVLASAGSNGPVIGMIDGGGEAYDLTASGTISGGYFTGGLIGTVYGTGAPYTVYDSHASTTVNGGSNLGGLFGQMYVGATANNVYATGNVGVSQANPAYNVGGLVGSGADGSLSNSYATGAVVGSSRVGGFAGLLDGTQSNIYATGSVTSTGTGDTRAGGLVGEFGGMMTGGYAPNGVTAQGDNIGGLIGYLDSNSIVTKSYATGAVTTQGANVGGLIGQAQPAYVVSDSFATGAVTTGTTSGVSGSVGGLIGTSFAGSVSQSYASGAVSGAGNIGGLIGNTTDYGNNAAGLTVSDSYATGSVTGTGAAADAATSYIGGLIGAEQHAEPTAGATITVTRTYATGLVSGQGVQGGLVGGNIGVISNSIWDRTSTGQTLGVGGVGTLDTSNPPTTSVTNLTSVQDTTPGASDYAFSATPYTNAGFEFGTTPGGTMAAPWVQVDTDGTLNGFKSATVGTRPFLLMEYATNIINAHQLQLAELALSTSYTLANDIDASSTSLTSGMWGPGGFVPIGYYNKNFIGSFNGHNYTISGLYIDLPNDGYVGLFGVAAASSTSTIIKDLTLADVDITGNYTGALAGNTGYDYNHATPEVIAEPIVNIHVSGTVTGAGEVGGLIGQSGSAISNSSSSASVIDNSALVSSPSNTIAGGLVGECPCTITSSSASGPVTALTPVEYAGGLVGNLLGQLSSSSASGSVNTNAGAVAVGGLVGSSLNGVVASSFATGNVVASGSTSYVGGLAGEAFNVQTSYATGQVTAPGIAGGLVGADGGGTITDSFATGGVTGAAEVGGLVGDAAESMIVDSYASGNVSGTSQVGGLVGFNQNGSGSGTTSTASIIGSAAGKTYATGAVTGTGASTGGLVGENQGTITLASYTNAGAGVTGAADAGGAVGLNDAGGTLTNVSVAAPVTGTSYTGGVVGDNLGSLTSVNFDGSVSGVGGVGGVVGVEEGGSSIDGAQVGANAATTVSATANDVGGIAGASFAAISSAFSGANVSGVDHVGGLVGYNSAAVGGLVSGTITGVDYVGGAVGLNYAAVNASVTAVVQGADYVGGAVGWNDGAGNVDSFASATAVTASGNYAGGLVGVNKGAVTGKAVAVSENGGAVGSVSGANLIGGLVGLNQGTITDSTAGVSVMGQRDVGGLVGLNDTGATIADASAAGAVIGTNYTGGVVGDNFGSLSVVSFDGSVSGGSSVGGIVGVEESGSSLSGAAVGANAATTVSGTANDVGGIAGASFAAISGAQSGAGVSGVDHVGGLVGYNTAALEGVESGTITGVDYVGGLVGLNFGAVSGTVSGAVNGADYVGGAVGWNDSAGTIASDATTATVKASGDYVGGLAGVNKGTLSSQFVGPNGEGGFAGSVIGADYVGGLVGLNQGAISHSGSLVAVSGKLYVGGLVGWNDTGATIDTSYAARSVTGRQGGQDASGNDYVGGLVGVNFGSIANAYATGKVSGVQIVGGLVGANMPGGSSVTTSYATGAVSASKGAVGTTFGVQAGEVSYVYGFPTLSGQPVESGYINAGSSGDGTDLAADQEDGSSAYVGFDFTNTWQSNPDGPPTLLAAPQP